MVGSYRITDGRGLVEMFNCIVWMHSEYNRAIRLRLLHAPLSIDAFDGTDRQTDRRTDVRPFHRHTMRATSTNIVNIAISHCITAYRLPPVHFDSESYARNFPSRCSKISGNPGGNFSRCNEYSLSIVVASVWLISVSQSCSVNKRLCGSALLAVVK